MKLVVLICSLLVVACQANNGVTPTTVNNYVQNHNNNYNINSNMNVPNPYNMPPLYQNPMIGPYQPVHSPNLAEGILHSVSDTVWNIGSLLGHRHY